MARVLEGQLSAAGLRFAIVVSRFNSFITERLLGGAMDAISRSGGSAELQLCDCQYQQRHRCELENQRPRLLNAPAPRGHCRLFSGCPETQGRYDQLAAGTIQQVQGDGNGGD